MGAVNATGLLAMLARPNPNADLFAYGPSSTQALISVYAMRMAAAFTLSVSTVGLRTLRTAALDLLPRLFGGADSAAGCWGAQVVPLLFPTWV
ncbi:MAG TPA: hypothetical protein VHR39_11780, partial [Propionibacteriaceae bacterium]|nr:hypothetical protein [Propionibacteriaceae bacterium]